MLDRFFQGNLAHQSADLPFAPHQKRLYKARLGQSCEPPSVDIWEDHDEDDKEKVHRTKSADPLLDDEEAKVLTK